MSVRNRMGQRVLRELILKKGFIAPVRVKNKRISQCERKTATNLHVLLLSRTISFVNSIQLSCGSRASYAISVPNAIGGGKSTARGVSQEMTEITERCLSPFPV